MAAPRGNPRVLGLTTLLLPLAQVVLAHQLFDKCFVPAALPLSLSVPELACPSLEDSHEATWLSQGSPWTHPPECEHSKDGTTQYCAYTNAGHGSRGWSIITTPETAADSVAFLSKMQNTSRARTSQEAAYKVVDIPGKGKGLVATRAIKQYEEILLDYATVMVDIMFTTEVPAILGYRLLHAAVDRLSDPASVLELGQNNGFAQDTVENILRTNAFHTPIGAVPHIALYPTVSVSMAVL